MSLRKTGYISDHEHLRGLMRLHAQVVADTMLRAGATPGDVHRLRVDLYDVIDRNLAMAGLFPAQEVTE